MLQEARAKQRDRPIDWSNIYVYGAKEMTEKIVGKPRSRSRTLWFSNGLIVSGAALFVAFLTSPALNVFLEANVPAAWMAVVVAVIGVAVRWLRLVTTEPLAE